MTTTKRRKTPSSGSSSKPTEYSASALDGANPLACFGEATRSWFAATFEGPTDVQSKAFPVIASGESALVLAPTGSGKTLAAFLASLDRLMTQPARAVVAVTPAPRARVGREKRGRATLPPKPVRTLYVSPLKALATDIERNLRAPIEGIVAASTRLGVPVQRPAVAMRSGDTPARDRAEFNRRGADILITTPESLYLLLTSDARRHLAEIETVIVDEIHAVASTKRGSHLFLSLERLEALRAEGAPRLQRVGLSATQRPLDVVARALAGVEDDGRTRPVTIVDAGKRRALELRIEVPVEDMGRLGRDMYEMGEAVVADGSDPSERSIWPSIHPRLVELIREHRSTMIFVNNRRLAERLAAAINDSAGEELASAHHGSIAHANRQIIEDRLKSGSLPAIVATSSLELGIDMGAVDLVIQIEAPPSVASGMQRVGRAGHRAGAVSKGVVFPKYRGDLLACAATVRAMTEGLVESTQVPENPLDVLAQQIVAMVSVENLEEEQLLRIVRHAAPFAGLPRAAYEGVLDMLSGLYPSDEFAELRPRIHWDRLTKVLSTRVGAKRVAISSGGTIADRGLYGVYLVGQAGTQMRVGELDEEMVFESRTGDVFLLGASSWRIEEITHDRVIVSPAPGEPGKMPFWRGDRPGRPAELGRRIGELTRRIASQSEKKAIAELERDYFLDARAAKNLQAYVAEQRDATGEVPSDRAIVIERFRDELGDIRVCVLSPFGAKVHAPWAMAVTASARMRLALEMDVIWSDDGIVFRIPEIEEFPADEVFLPDASEVEDLVTKGLDQTALFAGRFRENAARSLLLPRKFPGKRTPLWAQRKRANDLLAVASRYGSFPVVLETYRECLRDALDLPALIELLGQVAQRQVRVVTVDSPAPSPFAGALLFSYVANFIYDGDAPLAERRAQALSLDHERLRELMGAVELRELLEEEAIDEVSAFVQRLTTRKVAHADGLHDLLLSMGDLRRDEVRARTVDEVDSNLLVESLLRDRRIVEVQVGGEPRLVAVEDIGRLRDAVGVMPPQGLPAAYLAPVRDALGDVVSRYARTHGPFTAQALATRFGLGIAPITTALERLAEAGRVVAGGFVPEGTGDEWCDVEVLRSIKRKSLALLRKEVEPVSPSTLARFFTSWQGVDRPRSGVDALVAAIEQLEGAPLPFTALIEDVLPARVRGFTPADLDYLSSTGEIVWRGVEPIGSSDGRVALHLAGRLALLSPPPVKPEEGVGRAIVDFLEQRGAVFFVDIAAQVGGFGGDVFEALWDLVWAGLVTNDTTAPLRGRFGGEETHRSRRDPRRPDRRRGGPPGSEGRWSLLRSFGNPSDTERAAALANVLLDRYGLVTRESVQAEGIAGGYSAVYPVLKAMEEAGRVRRGYFVSGLGAMQFARLGADERLRALRASGDEPSKAIVLAATDPANVYGSMLPWPDQTPDESDPERSESKPQRAAGAHVVIHEGELIAYLGRGQKNLRTFLAAADPLRGEQARALADALGLAVDVGARRALMIGRIDGDDPRQSRLAPLLVERGFSATGEGLLKRRAGSFVRPR